MLIPKAFQSLKLYSRVLNLNFYIEVSELLSTLLDNLSLPSQKMISTCNADVKHEHYAVLETQFILVCNEVIQK